MKDAIEAMAKALWRSYILDVVGDLTEMSEELARLTDVKQGLWKEWIPVVKAALLAAEAKGMKLVGREPTEEMHQIGVGKDCELEWCESERAVRIVWKTMWDTAPRVKDL